jgi:hypothetical protein
VPVKRPPVARIYSFWVDQDGLSDAETANLAGNLSSIVRGTEEQLRLFMIGVRGSINIFVKGSAPRQRDEDLRAHKLERLRNAAQDYAKAVEALDRGCWGDLNVRFFMDLRQADRSEDPKVAGEQLDKARSDVESVIASGAIANAAAQAAEKILKEKTRQVSKSRVPIPERVLIKDVARVFDQVYKEKPSASRGGVFARALRQILDVLKIRNPDEKALSTILADIDWEFSGAAPRRGRKPKMENPA